MSGWRVNAKTKPWVKDIIRIAALYPQVCVCLRTVCNLGARGKRGRERSARSQWGCGGAQKWSTLRPLAASAARVRSRERDVVQL